MYKNVVVILFLIVSCVLQHVSHELLHVFSGKKLGLPINKIKWFTYHGGTKEYFEGDEQIVELDGDIPKEWIDIYESCRYYRYNDIGLSILHNLFFA